MAETLELEERRSSIRRFMRLGTGAWTVFFVTDLVAAHAFGAPIEYLGALRFAGAGIGVAAYILLRARAVPAAIVTAIETAVFPLAAVFVALGAIPCGGIASPLAQGAGVVTLVRATIPAPWSRAFPSTLATALAFPVVCLASTFFVPEIKEQLRSPAIWTFILTNLFLLLSAVISAAGSNLQWKAGRQVHEARRLGSYRLVARVGSGGMGEVWLARQLPLDRAVALKIMKDKTLLDEGAIRRFKREAQASSTLAHPNTIRIFDFGASDDGVLYIAMELLDGLDLEALMAKTGPLHPARAVHFGRQACASLAEAHHRGIIHCDIKPANLFVCRVSDQFDFVKVLDFGLARLTAGPGASTVIDSIRGTPAFMPPEVIRGERVGPESDVYAMGALLYFMMTGTTVFETKNFHEMIRAHLEAVPERPSSRIGTPIPRDVEDVILRCLAKERGERFVTARELGEALGRTSIATSWTQEDAKASWELIRPSVRTMVTKA